MNGLPYGLEGIVETAWLIGEGIQRLAGREDSRSYSEVAPGERYSLEVALIKDFAYTIPAGHRLGIMISASNWPLFARNPADGAVFMRADATEGTDETFTYGFPATEVPLKGDGVAIVNTLYLDGACRVELSLAP